jgi:hypothetical protein
MLTDRVAEAKGVRLCHRSMRVGRMPMGAIYKPFGIIMGLIAGQLAKKIADWVWKKFDDEDPPTPTTEQAEWGKVLSAAALQGIIFKLTRAVVERNAAQGFAYLTGTWPGEKRPDPDR